MYAYFKINVLWPSIDVYLEYAIISDDFNIYRHTCTLFQNGIAHTYPGGPQMIRAIVRYSEITDKYPVGSIYNGVCHGLELFKTKEDLMAKYFFEIF
jgi:hypothetical protein